MTGSKPLSGRMVLAILLVSFGIVIAINAIFVVYSIASFPGEEEARSYAQGLQYNATLRDRRAQAALGWRATAALVRDGEHAAAEIVLHDAADRPLEGLALSGALRRPTDAAMDHALAFSGYGNGRYRAELFGVAQGQWDLRVRAQRGEEHFDIEKRLLWPPPRS
jgi:nitrogen fixation protein FixH